MMTSPFPLSLDRLPRELWNDTGKRVTSRFIHRAGVFGFEQEYKVIQTILGGFGGAVSPMLLDHRVSVRYRAVPVFRK